MTLQMTRESEHSQALAAAITRSASKQTYYTIRLLVDPDRVADAYRAYGYLRWVDDVLDADTGTRAFKLEFADRQKSLLESCYRGETPSDLCAHERMLVDLVQNDPNEKTGLWIYLNHMMAVMLLDAERRGRTVSQAELSEYTRKLATAVTEAMYYFVGYQEPPPPLETRYLSVTAAHITHMLRDTVEDIHAGYFNIPREFLSANNISPTDVASEAYREWVYQRVRLARSYFEAGREGISRLRNLRRRLAAYAYMARFEWVLQIIERDHYMLRSEYRERKTWRAGLWMGWTCLGAALAPVPRQSGPLLR